MKIKITADSTCDLSPEQIAQNGIKITPLFVNMGGKSYQDGIDIQPAEIFRTLPPAVSFAARRRFRGCL